MTGCINHDFSSCPYTLPVFFSIRLNLCNAEAEDHLHLYSRLIFCFYKNVYVHVNVCVSPCRHLNVTVDSSAEPLIVAYKTTQYPFLVRFNILCRLTIIS